MDHQDFTIVNIGNPNLKKKREEKKIIQKKTNVDLHKFKIENEQENFQIAKIPKELSRQITDARVSKKINQQDLANKLNIQKNRYIELENGKANYDPSTKQLIQKIQKNLGVVFKK